jgi:glucuronate isomerase
MKRFMDEDFLLESSTSERLYHDYAEKEPIYDYHCHLSPAEIAADARFDNLASVWLGGDHYKWRQMRWNGIDERFITGDADPYEKFLAWAGTVDKLVGNPLYHWTHLELKRYFGIDETLSPSTAKSIWDRANERLAGDGFSVKGILHTFNVHALGTTDDPADSLEAHAAIASGTAPIGRLVTKVIPSFRPDRSMNIERGDYPDYVSKLGESAGMRIGNVADLLSALAARLDYFVGIGCRSSDHGLEYVPRRPSPAVNVDSVFRAALAGKAAGREEADAFRLFVLESLAREYSRRGMVMQLHLGASRNANSRMFARLGPDTGYDASSDASVFYGLASFLDGLSSKAELPRMVVYALNPKDYCPIATLLGCFQEGSGSPRGGDMPGKLQLGAAWWFCDHRDGMEEQLRSLANLGMLSRFIGMLTDSRSFLSYPRHEYFRRILCNLLGAWVENGEAPNDMSLMGGMARDISFGNALGYFAAPGETVGP